MPPCLNLHRHSECCEYLNRVLPPASPKMTGVCGGTWKYPFPFWTRFSCSPFTAEARRGSECGPQAPGVLFWDAGPTVVDFVLFLVHGVDASSGPEFQESLKQQAAQVH